MKKREETMTEDLKGLKVNFPHFHGEEPLEWLDKADHHFHLYKVSKEEWVSIACFYLDGKTNKW